MANWLTYRIRVGDDVLVLADEAAQELIKNETERSKKADAQTASFLESTTTNGIIRNRKSDPFGQTAIGGMKVVIDKGDLIINGNIKNHARLTRTYNVTQENRTEVFLYRYDSVTNEITGLWRDCIIQGDIILSREDKTELPLRSSGYYDILICKITIPAGATEITQDMIGDFRQNEYYCGYAKNILVEIDETLTKSDAAADAAAVGAVISDLRNETRTRDIITEKRITNLEAGLPAERWSVDDSVAYIKEVPENALPFASVDMVGGMTRKCNQLWDEQWTTGYYDTTNGNFTNSSTFFASKNKIKVSPNTTYYMTCSIEQRFVFYDIDQNYISGVEYTYNSVFTTPDGCYYMTFSLWGTYGDVYKNDIMLNEGTEPLPYEPYFDGLRSAPVTEVESVGKCLFPASAVYGSFAKEVQKDGRNCYKYVTASDKKTLPYNFKENTQYTFRIDHCAVKQESGAMAGDIVINIWYSDGTNKQRNGSTDGTWHTVYVTSDAGKTITAVGVKSYEYRVDNYIDINTFRVVEGTEIADDCPPYRRETLPIPEVVQSLDGYGWGVNDTLYNYIDFEKKQFIKRVEKVVFKGENSELWKLGGYGDFIYTNANIAKPIDAEKIYLISDRYEDVSFGGRLNKSFPIAYVSLYDTAQNLAGLFFRNTGFSAVSKWQTYLAEQYASGKPVTIYYELATPVITDISDLLPDDNLIGVEGGGTVTMVNEYGYDVPSEITYQLKGAEA